MLSVFATYFLVFIGGLVRVSGAGLGCPDWPHCFGGWFPPVSEAHLLQLQQHAEPGTILSQIQPEHFNYTLAWIEYLNRLVGVAVGFCILAMVVVAVLKTRKYKGLVWGSIGVLLLTGFQGWLGGMVVKSDLHHALVSVHMVIALVMVSLLLADELSDAYSELETISRKSEGVARIIESEEKVSRTLESFAERIEGIAAGLEQA